MVEATDVADLAAEALKQTTSTQFQIPPPAPLPTGWLLKESRSHPNAYYYYNQESGECTWIPPFSLVVEEENREPKSENVANDETGDAHPNSGDNIASQSTNPADVPDDSPRSRKRVHKESSSPSSSSATTVKKEDAKPVEKKRRTNSSSSSSSTPKEVRVLHILRKHKDSRRPSSWRTNNKPITITRDEAVEELNGLLEILHDEESNPESLIATFKELASEESDCSSAKRHGDLGFFGRKKMRPEFEQAAFGLDINQLSGIVETASGAHILLRLE
mmetsp:Transcript_12532/g.34771  ORF Transcript_12532/g.34771 Transcript_12532/m.34771 type:complete len:276 (-) Transcript_12532:15-842(-)|eukprot:CAMPEP_0168785700 /NCGR_PEP_ID=MMETSP0725-20121227/10888_1 /TAXON_ID=265536 /ORGANISM="Amphiprora sp., Strain CCMP467" /LENGTH=275 /DNA_ID=CAMNT_0008835819 /DNA_START=144 /DNA_END=971 /DNA_ORIENTATION=-